ncbi:MAG: nucleotide exchange factor GrpE, partial [Patescibacteria group bacterium]
MEENTINDQDPQDPSETPIQSEGSELEKAKKEAQDYLDGWKRAKADFINYKNEQDKRSKELVQFAGLSAIIKIVPVMESFRLAFSHVPTDTTDSDWVKGVEQIYKQLQEAMKALGVEQETGIEGAQFDPMKHEAVAQESDATKEEGVILKEVNAGYSVHGR